MTSRLLVLPAIVLVGLGVGACGGTGSASRDAGAHARPGKAYVVNPGEGYIKDDEDTFNDDTKGSQNDDIGRWSWGREANGSERKALTAVVKRYYAAASADNGAAACTLMSPTLSKSSNFERLLPEDYRPAPGSTLFQDKDCAQVEALLFATDQSRFVQEAATMRVIGARVSDATSLVLLGFRSTGERELTLRREGGTWRIAMLLDQKLP